MYIYIYIYTNIWYNWDSQLGASRESCEKPSADSIAQDSYPAKLI